MSLVIGCKIVESRSAALDVAEESICELRAKAPLCTASDVEACAMALRVAALNLTCVAAQMRATPATKYRKTWWNKD